MIDHVTKSWWDASVVVSSWQTARELTSEWSFIQLLTWRWDCHPPCTKMLECSIHLPGPWNNDQHPPLLTVMWLLTGRVLKPEVCDAGSSPCFVLGQSARFSYKMNNLQSENFSTNAFQTKETSTHGRVLGLQAARWPAKHFSCQPNSSLCQDSQHQSPFYCIEDFFLKKISASPFVQATPPMIHFFFKGLRLSVHTAWHPGSVNMALTN